MYLGDLIKEFRTIHKMSLRDFAQRCGLSHTYISALEKNIDPRTGKPIAPTLDTVKYVAHGMNTSVEEILKGIDEQQSFIVNKDISPDNLCNQGNIVTIPILGTVKAGYNWLAEENVVDYITLKEPLANSGEYYALRITGDSMLPLLSEGDLVIVHDQDDVESGQTAVILINGEEATVKKLIKTKDGIELHAMNPYYPVKKFSFEDMNKVPVKIIGRVKEAKIKGIFE